MKTFTQEQAQQMHAALAFIAFYERCMPDASFEPGSKAYYQQDLHNRAGLFEGFQKVAAKAIKDL